ncbi:MAG: hypothetical protein IPK04_03030 [Bdellovibrionales bacterium]|nr:hypothetical protein [Bdellovibrionales bacterium]
MKIIAFLFGMTFLLSSIGPAKAMNIDWNGGYRFEYTEIDRPSLADPGGRKSYGLNYLYLQPQIIATDGVTINSRLDVLSNQSSAYRGSQLGQLWGGTVSDLPDTSANNTTRENMGATNVSVSQLYLHVSQEYGSLVLGRMPYEFGLGMTHNAGKGAFDHWIDTHDLVGYKFVVGSLFFMPMLGKVYHADAGQGYSNTEQLLQIQYDNADSGSLLGLLFERRNAGNNAVSDGAGWLNSWQTYYGDNTASIQGDFSFQRTSFILGRSWSTFGFKLEGGFSQGQTGVQMSTGNQLRLNGYGIASEIYYRPEQVKWSMNLRLGIATGDDPGTLDNYEGYQFDRNYDVAFLLFNHRLGQRDFLGTAPFRPGGYSVSNSFDDESISNTVYVSPRIKTLWSDKVDLVNTLTYAQLLNKTRGSVDSDKSLGFEWDIEVVYRPRERIQWVNQFGYLFAGDAFKEGASNLSNGNSFGFSTKAAISF